MHTIGIELELFVLLGLLILGASVFAPFEVETAAWRKALKWVMITVITVALHSAIGHWAALVPLAFGLLGATVHWVWCRKHGIHPIHATPRRRYYELRGWQWHE